MNEQSNTVSQEIAEPIDASDSQVSGPTQLSDEQLEAVAGGPFIVNE